MQMLTSLETKRTLAVILAAALFVFASSAPTYSQSNLETLDNGKVISLVAAGITDSILIPKIRASRVFLDASENALVEMKRAGVSDAVVVALFERASVYGFISSSPREAYSELPAGTEVKILTKKKISGKKAKDGQRVELEVAEDVVSPDGRIAISKGAAVSAVVSDARKPGFVGRGGRLSLYLESTTAVDGLPVRLRGAKSGVGGDNFGSMYTMSILLGPAGLLRRGENAKIKPGTIFTAFVDETRFVRIPVR